MTSASAKPAARSIPAVKHGEHRTSRFYRLRRLAGQNAREDCWYDMQILKAIAAHPLTSLQDALLIGMLMLGATVVALEYDLLRHGEGLSPQARRIQIEELLVLSGLLVGGIALFAMRRQNELRRDLRMAEEVHRLRGEANTDPLTGLPNRRAVLLALSQALEEGEHEGRVHAFFLLDLDGFKQVNDQWGHATGDHVLRLVADRLRAAARPTDLLGRLGGDEFALLAYDVGQEQASAIGHRLASALRAPIVANQCSNRVGVSIGVALLPSDGSSCEEILAKADVAMYRAKGLADRALDFYQPCSDGHLQIRA